MIAGAYPFLLLATNYFEALEKTGTMGGVYCRYPHAGNDDQLRSAYIRAE
jgi:hypothetical protein